VESLQSENIPGKIWRWSKTLNRRCNLSGALNVLGDVLEACPWRSERMKKQNIILRDHVPLIGDIVTLYLIVAGIIALLR